MEKIELFAQERASQYDLFVEQWIPNYPHFMQILPKILSKIQEKKLLAVGCGTGNEVLSLLQSDVQWQITALDPSPEMIVQAAEKLQHYHHVQLFEGVLKDLPNKEQYAAATLLLVLHFMPDDGTKQQLLNDIYNKLKIGAPLILLDISSDQMTENLAILSQLVADDITPQEIEMRLQRLQNELHATSSERLQQLLTQAGFSQPVRFFQSSIYQGWQAYKISCS